MIVVAATTAFVAVTPATAHASETVLKMQSNRVLTPDEISGRIAEITQQYDEVGDILSPKDAAFIRLYALPSSAENKDPVTQPVGVSSFTFSKSGSGAGATGRMYGSGSLNNGDFRISNSWKFNVTASGSSTVTKIKNCGYIRAYGSVGQSGIGVVYSADRCETNTGNYNYTAKGESYTAFVVYSTMQVISTFYTPLGSFQVSS